MADQLYLSYQLRDRTSQAAVRSFEKMLRTFPYSKLSRSASTLRINAVSPLEPPLFEKSFDDPPDIGAVMQATAEFVSPDCGMHFETRWDLWQFEADWKMTPTRVTLAAFAPEFDSGLDDDLRIEFGIDTAFLPQPDLPNALFMARSNVRSLLHLVHELDRSLKVEQRRLWTESGVNFAEHLKAALEESDAAQP